MKDQSFSLSLSDTVARADRLELPAEIAEFAIDQAISSDVLKDVPFVGWIAKGMATYRSITDQIFFNKILRFLTQLKALGSKEKEAFSEKVKSEPEFRRKVGERLIVAIERLDEPDKSEFLAKAFDSFLEGLVSYEEFSEFAHVIDRSFLTDLRSLVHSSASRNGEWKRMVASGLAEIELKEPKWEGGNYQIGYQYSNVGWQLSLIFEGKYADHLAAVASQWERARQRDFAKSQEPKAQPLTEM